MYIFIAATITTSPPRLNGQDPCHSVFKQMFPLINPLCVSAQNSPSVTNKKCSEPLNFF